MTSKLRRDDREFLHDILASLLKRFSSDELLLTIAEIQEIPFDRLRGQPSSEKEKGIQRARVRSSERPSAVLIAQRADAPLSKRNLLVTLASQFDHKAFLPTLPDIRHFLEMRGQELGNVKQRSDAFRKIIAAIAAMPEDSLERLIASSRHSGPAQLGPLSDAIKAVGASSRSERINSSSFAHESSAHLHSDTLPSETETAPETAAREWTLAGSVVEKDEPRHSDSLDSPSDAAADINATLPVDRASDSTQAIEGQAVATEFVKKDETEPSAKNMRPHNRYEALRSPNRSSPKRGR